VGFAVTPSVAIAYAIVATGLYALANAKPLAVPAPHATPAE
jgi:hypothetical protein